MTSNEILKADVLDILFDNRNKQYGAYVLRKNYSHRLGMALGISISAVLLVFFLLPKNPSSKIVDGSNAGAVVIKTVEFPKDIKKFIPPSQPKPIVQRFRQQQFTRLVIVDKKDVPPPPDLRIFETSLISDKTIDGTIATNTPIINDQGPASVSEKTDQKKNSSVDILEREPQFPGGLEAWLNFLRKNLVAPEELEPGEKKTVSVRFFVSNDGSVTAFEVLQSAGKSFDNEVIRVLKKMPKWKPAIQNGQAVARAFTQPVTFIGVEQ
jgi:periplasmic protein TonB